MRTFHQYQFASAPPQDVEAYLKQYQLSTPSPRLELPPDMLACQDGIGVFCNPEEGQAMLLSFNAVLHGFQTQGREVPEEESERLRRLLYAEAISPQLVRQLVLDYEDASIAAAFLMPQDCDTYSVEYLLRRYRGQVYRQRYPSITIVDA